LAVETAAKIQNPAFAGLEGPAQRAVGLASRRRGFANAAADYEHLQINRVKSFFLDTTAAV
jgi:hypothetical protein